MATCLRPRQYLRRAPGPLGFYPINQPNGGFDMAWTAPELKEINCGMEINMYTPAEDEGREYEQDLF